MGAKKTAIGIGPTNLLLLCNAAIEIGHFLRLAKDDQVYLAKNILQCTKLFAHKAHKVISGHHHEASGENSMNNNSMNAPKILPWIARKAGISDELALKLWRRALSEAEYLVGKAEGSKYWGLAVERFLAIVEDEVGCTPQYSLTPAPRLSWMWNHQTRMSLLSLMAAQNAYRYWQTTWENMYPEKKVA